MNPQENIKKVEPADVRRMLERYQVNAEAIQTIESENLLPPGLIKRLHNAYPRHSGFFLEGSAMFRDKPHYSGIKGFREIVQILK